MNETLSRLIEPARHAEWPEDAAISRERWENLSARLIDAMNLFSSVSQTRRLTPVEEAEVEAVRCDECREGFWR